MVEGKGVRALGVAVQNAWAKNNRTTTTTTKKKEVTSSDYENKQTKSREQEINIK